MIKNILYILFIIPLFVSGQTKPDTTHLIKEVVVTATMTEKSIQDIPGRMALITSEDMEDQVVNNSDDLLRSIANVYVNRSWGIFSKNSSITMRGMDGSARVLVLLDNIPLNKTAGGAINWHMINPEMIDRIEVLKGPCSALYGSNAMGGVINIMSKYPDEKISVNANLFGGSYNTVGGDFLIGSNYIKDGKGIFWNLNGFYHYGEGYIFEPEEVRDETDVETFLRESGTGAKIGYQFNSYNKLEINYLYFDDSRGGGKKIFEEKGSYLSYPTNTARIRYKGEVNKFQIEANAFFTREDYYELKESLNEYNEYKLSEIFMNSSDMGAWAAVTKEFGIQKITVGFDMKYGLLDGQDIYRTSYDHIMYQGELMSGALFVQDDINLCKKTNVIIGIRYDNAKYFNGGIDVENPSKATGFTENVTEFYESNEWNSFSPKLALRHNFNDKVNVYISYGTGFNPPKLKDLASSGKISKGFKISNPYIIPEVLSNYEIGTNILLFDKVKIEPSVYYSYGKDFQYLVSTGDSVDTGSDEFKPVYMKDNVSGVEIIGCEMSVEASCNKYISIFGSYSYNYSKIKKFSAVDNISKDLTGKFLMEVSPHLFFTGLKFNSKFVNASLTYQFIDKQFSDDENLTYTGSYSLIDLRIYKKLKKHYTVYINIDNLLDNEYIDRKGQLSPGRFIICGLKFIL
ncbi:MAG: TonB-dependent receptor [Bacteroidota bacterium]